MDSHSVDTIWLSEAAGGDRILNCHIKPTDGTTIFAYFGNGGKLKETSQWKYEIKFQNKLKVKGFEPW